MPLWYNCDMTSDVYVLNMKHIFINNSFLFKSWNQHLISIFFEGIHQCFVYGSIDFTYMYYLLNIFFEWTMEAFDFMLNSNSTIPWFLNRKVWLTVYLKSFGVGHSLQMGKVREMISLLGQTKLKKMVVMVPSVTVHIHGEYNRLALCLFTVTRWEAIYCDTTAD